MGNIPYILKSVKSGQFQGFSGILESWIPGSRSHNIFQKVQKIYTNMLCRLVFYDLLKLKVLQGVRFFHYMKFIDHLRSKALKFLQPDAHGLSFKVAEEAI